MSKLTSNERSKRDADNWYPKHLVDGMDARDVRHADEKLANVLQRIAKLSKWNCGLSYHVAKSWCLYKLRKQRDFLQRIVEVKEDFECRKEKWSDKALLDHPIAEPIATPIGELADAAA